MRYSGQETRSRFRILKGGKISLVVSALLVGASLVGTDADADTIVTIDNNTSTQNVTVNENKTIRVEGTLNVADSVALYVSGNLSYLATITNSGSISSVYNGANAYGIKTTDIPVNLTNNSGSTISATSTHTATSVLINNVQDNTSIINDGTISATGTGITSGIKINPFIDYFYHDSITNTDTGTITVDSTNSAYGIRLGNGFTTIMNTNISNSGTIDVNGTNGAIGIGALGDLTNGSSIENTQSGTIEVKATNGSAIGIEANYLRFDSSIVNSGTITISGNSGYAIKAAKMYNTSTITNDTLGVISALGESGATDIVGIDILIMGGSSKITNKGTISAYIDNELDKDAYSMKVAGMLETSTVENTSTGKLYGNIDVNGVMSNAGLISLPHNATNANVGDFTNQSTGTLEIGLLTDGEITTHSKLATYNATFENGSTIKVNVLAASTNVSLLKDTRLFDVVSASNSLTIDGTLNVTDNSALLNFEYEQDGNLLDLIAVEANANPIPNTNPIPSAGGTGNIFNTTKLGNGNNNALSTARALDTINAGNHPQMNQLFTQLNQLPTDAEVAAAADSLTPQATNASFGAGKQISKNISGMLGQRQQANTGSGFNSGDEMFASKNIWLKTYGSFGSQNDKDGLNGFDIKSYGLGMGVDAEYKDNQTIGIALFYTRANLDVNNLSQSSDMDVYTTLVYGNLPIFDDKTNFLYQLGYAWQKTSSDRTLFTGQTAYADYTSTTASVDLKLIRDYSLNKSFLLQPMVSTTYRHFDNPSYSETDAGVNGLKVNSFTSSQFLVGLGTLANYKLDNVSKIVGNVKVEYDTIGDNTSVTSSYLGALGVTFDTAGIDNGRWQYEAGVGYEREVIDGHNINISYNYQGIGTDFSNNIISAKYVYSF